MIYMLLSAVLSVSIATLAIVIRALRNSRRSEDFSGNNYKLLGDQHDRLELLREERRMLREEFERESRERLRLQGNLERERT